MKNNRGKQWTREETILAFDLYCRTPFGKISASNKEIIKLAELLGRTTGSVALKMSNLAHYDPDLKARNVNGMAHGSKLDAVIFNEFYKDIEDLAYEARRIKKSSYGLLEEELDLSDLSSLPPGEYREVLAKTRIGQYAFRTAILNSYNERCCVTGLSLQKLLVASHIKPWAVCDESSERTNPCNGLCLNTFHDKAFDLGFITIDRGFRIIISSQLKKADMDENTKNWLMKYAGEKITLPDKFIPGLEFIEYHNDMVFKP